MKAARLASAAPPQPASSSAAPEQRAYSSRDVVRLTGITPRQLQWWDEKKIVVPSRDGRNRSYTFADVAELSVIAALRRKGFSLQRVRKVMRWLQKELGERLAHTVLAGGEHHLLTDGRTIYLEDSAHAVLDLLNNARQPMFGVCLSAEVHALRAQIASFAAGGQHASGAKTSKQQLTTAPFGRPERRRSTAIEHPMKKNTRVRQTRAAS